VYTVRQTQDFQAWLDHLSDRRAQVRIAARIRLAEMGNLGDWQPAGGKVSEMRIDIGPDTGSTSCVEASQRHFASGRRQVDPETRYQEPNVFWRLESE
jgi:hypothetical protein